MTATEVTGWPRLYLVVGGGEFGIEGILVEQDFQVLLVDGQHLDVPVERKLGDIGVRIARAHEEAVNLTVLQGVFALGLAEEPLVDVVIVHVIGSENLPGGDFVARTGGADADALVFHVGHALNAAVLADNDLHHLRIAGGHRGEAVHHSALGKLLGCPPERSC